MIDSMQTFSRRHLLAGASATAALLLGYPAVAKAPQQNTPAPGFYRFKIGGFEATVVSDGPLDMGEPKDGVFVGLTKDEPIGRFLRRISTSKFEAANGPATLCGVAVETDDKTGLATRVAAVRIGARLEQARPAFLE